MDYFQLACSITNNYAEKIRRENLMDQQTENVEGGAPANGTKLSDLADIYLSWRLEKENAEEQLKKANEMIRKTEQEIYEKMQTEEIEKFAHAGQLFFPRVESHPSVNKAREPEFYEWLREHNEDGIMKLTIHPQMLKSWYRQHEEFAEELASNDFLKVFEEIRISVRKAG